MADYRHNLEFGTFITPQSRRPQDVVALAQLSERAGLDLVTFQDHPYQPAFLDTWTLLSWVAAQTEGVRLSGNVFTLPRRPPAVLARAAASLDLLSGGRFELGLGAGAFWDAIEAMGGPQRTPGQAVDALEEAIDVIRAIWDVSGRAGVRVDGEHYSVWGAKRGPEPAHDISIWLGAVKPRMLRLIGRKADGWIPPSLPYLIQGDLEGELERGNRIIDEAALAAGREPREIRRLFNISGAFTTSRQGLLQGPPEQWVEDLLPLVLEHGFSTFILITDDPRMIEVFAGEVAPALREAVANERDAAGTPVGEVVHSPKALALRREGIDYEGVPASLRSKAIEPCDKDYAKVRSTYLRTGSPGLVTRPESVEEVVEALGFARKQEVTLSVRSGGHGISGRSTNDGGIVIDLAKLNQIEVLDPESGRIRLGPAARWGHVARALAPHGLAMSSGDYGDVGVGGLATAGGIGFLARKHGLTIGIVTALELDAYPLREVVFSDMVFDGSDIAPLLERWGRLVESAPRELTSFLYAFAQRGTTPTVRLLNVYAGDDTEAAVDALRPLLEIGPLLDQQASLAPYAAIVAPHDNQHYGGQRRPLVSNGLANRLTPEMSEQVELGLRTRVASWISIRSAGGAVNDL